jgi:hypothetical protein
MVYCQYPSHYTYKDEQIGSNTVYNLCEFDHYIYAATENGIVKIDQGKTTVYRDKESVKNSYTQFQVGPDGGLYTLNFGNQIYRVTNDGLELYLDLREDFSHPVQSYNFFHDYIYVSSNHATRRYVVSSLKKDSLWEEKGTRLEGHIVGDTLFLGVNKITDDSVYFNAASKIMGKKYQAHARDPFLVSPTVSGHYMAVNGSVYSERGHLIKFKQYLPEASNMHYLKVLDEDRIWLSSNAGALIFNPKDKEEVEVLFPEQSISDILVDEQGKIWVATLGDGIKVIPDVQIKYYASPSIVSAFTIDKQGKESYVGTESGDIYNLSQLTGKPLLKVDSKINALYVEEDQFYVSHLNANALFVDEKLAKVKPISPKADRIIKVNDLVLFSSWHGVDLTTSSLVAYDSMNSFLKQNTYTVGASTRLKENLSPLWISADFDQFLGLQNGKLVARGNVTIPEEIQDKDFSDLQVYENQPFLLSRSGEVWTYSVANNQFDNLFKVNCNVGCQRLAVSNFGFFLYESGIIHYFSNKGHYSYTAFSRFKHEELIDFRASKNYLFVVYRNGVHRIPIASLQRIFETVSLPLELLVDGVLMPEHDSYSITSGEHSIVVRFNHFDELLSPGTYFLYQINAGDWMAAESRSQLQLNGLSSGKYWVKIRIDRPVGSPVYKKIFFEIRPYWYETLWFYLGMSFFALLLVIFYFLKRIKSIRNRQQMENEIVHARMAKINAQMKPHFIFNVLTSIQSMILREDRIQASNAIGEFAEFIRNTLDISKRESITIREELAICEKYIQLEQRRRIREFDYQINVDHISGSIFQVQIPPLIIQPYVENAIIHGLNHLNNRKGSLIINLVEERDLLCITILDNGVGRSYKTGVYKEPEKVHKSFANSANYNRFSLINRGRVQIVDLDEGTKVIIEIPIEK